MIGVQGECPDENGSSKGPWQDFVQPSVTEQRTHFGLWCVLSSPLTLSVDFRNQSAVDSVWDVISNKEAIGVNQQWVGTHGGVFNTSERQVELKAGEHVPAWQAWYKPLPRGGAAVFVANHDSASAEIAIEFGAVPGLSHQSYVVTDVWTGQSSVASRHAVPALASHDSVFLTLMPTQDPLE